MPNYTLHILTPLSKVIHVAHQDFLPVFTWISIYFCLRKFELGLDYSKLIVYFWKKINSRIFFQTLPVKITKEFFMGSHFWYETDSIWGRVVPIIFQGSIYFNDRDNFREKNNDFQNMTWCVPIIWSPNDQNLTTRFKFIGIKWSSVEGGWLALLLNGGPSQYIYIMTVSSELFLCNGTFVSYLTGLLGQRYTYCACCSAQTTHKLVLTGLCLIHPIFHFGFWSLLAMKLQKYENSM